MFIFSGFKRLKADRKAVTAIEYAILAALIALAIIAALTLAGSSLKSIFSSVDNGLLQDNVPLTSNLTVTTSSACSGAFGDDILYQPSCFSSPGATISIYNEQNICTYVPYSSLTPDQIAQLSPADQADASANPSDQYCESNQYTQPGNPSLVSEANSVPFPTNPTYSSLQAYIAAYPPTIAPQAEYPANGAIDIYATQTTVIPGPDGSSNGQITLPAGTDFQDFTSGPGTGGYWEINTDSASNFTPLQQANIAHACTAQGGTLASYSGVNPPNPSAPAGSPESSAYGTGLVCSTNKTYSESALVSAMDSTHS